MHYNVIYDLGQSGYQNWSQLVFSLVFIIFSVLAMQLIKRTGWRISPNIAVIPTLLCGFGLLSSLPFCFNYWLYLDIQHQIRHVKNESIKTVEGVISKLHQPIRYSSGVNGTRDDPAEFMVGNIQFRCWDVNTQRGHIGFQRSDLLQEGLQVRISYVSHNSHENIITRMEIAQ
jgi:hypothetical protein